MIVGDMHTSLEDPSKLSMFIRAGNPEKKNSTKLIVHVPQ